LAFGYNFLQQTSVFRKTKFVLNENTNRNFFEKKATRKKISGKPDGMFREFETVTREARLLLLVGWECVLPASFSPFFESKPYPGF